MELPSALNDLVNNFSRISGIGPKTALRYALYLSNWNKEDLSDFGSAIRSLSTIKKCQRCGLFADENLCSICQSDERFNTPLLCVIETIADCLAIERGQNYTGKYHILGGVLNPLLGIGPEQLNINKLVQRIEDEEISEVVLALNPSVEGDATCAYIKQLLSDRVKIGRIGLGMPMGGSLEYLDPMTISKAIENRTQL